MVVTFQEGHEERSAAADGGSDDMLEESFEDEDPAPAALLGLHPHNRAAHELTVYSLLRYHFLLIAMDITVSASLRSYYCAALE
jgi:hypothetical protein